MGLSQSTITSAAASPWKCCEVSVFLKGCCDTGINPLPELLIKLWYLCVSQEQGDRLPTLLYMALRNCWTGFSYAREYISCVLSYYFHVECAGFDLLHMLITLSIKKNPVVFVVNSHGIFSATKWASVIIRSLNLIIVIILRKLAVWCECHTVCLPMQNSGFICFYSLLLL